MKYEDELPVPYGKHKPGLNKTWPAYLILTLGIAATVFGWRYAQRQVEEKLNTLFQTEKIRVINHLAQAVTQQHEVLRSFQNLYGSSVQVVRDMFELYAAVPAKMYEGVVSITYAPSVKDAGKAAFMEYARNEGYWTYAIKPEGSRAEYYPIEYIVPFESNSHYLGFDLNAMPELSGTIERAKRDGRITGTAIQTLPGNDEPTLLLIAPIYQAHRVPKTEEDRVKNFLGLCIVELHLKRFLESAIGNVIDTARIAFAAYEMVSNGSDILLFESPGGGSAILAEDEEIRIGQVAWRLHFDANPKLALDVNTSFPYVLLASGVIASTFLFGFLLSLISSRGRALDLAERMTRSQRRIVDSSQDIICAMSFDGVWKTMNPASERVLGFTPSEMVGKSHEEYLSAYDRDVLKKILESPDEQPTEFEARYEAKSGDIRWIQWSVTPSRRDALIYMIGKDVTARKEAEREIQLKNKQLAFANLVVDLENLRREQSIRKQSMEFRMELTSVLGYHDLVLNSEGSSREEEMDFIRTANESAQGLLHAVSELTEVRLARSANVRIIPEKMSVEDFIASLRERYEINVHGIAYGLSVTLDRNRFDDAVASLVERFAETRSIHAEIDDAELAVRIPLRAGEIDTIRTAHESRSSLSHDEAALMTSIALASLESMEGTVDFVDENELTIRFPVSM